MAGEGPSKNVNPEAQEEGQQEEGKEDPWKLPGQEPALGDEGWRTELIPKKPRDKEANFGLCC